MLYEDSTDVYPNGLTPYVGAYYPLSDEKYQQVKDNEFKFFIFISTYTPPQSPASGCSIKWKVICLRSTMILSTGSMRRSLLSINSILVEKKYTKQMMYATMMYKNMGKKLVLCLSV